MGEVKDRRNKEGRGDERGVMGLPRSPVCAALGTGGASSPPDIGAAKFFGIDEMDWRYPKLLPAADWRRRLLANCDACVSVLGLLLRWRMNIHTDKPSARARANV